MCSDKEDKIEPIEWVTDDLLLIGHTGVSEGEKYIIEYKGTEYTGHILFAQNKTGIFRIDT